jgi:hypothetical protein
VPQQPKHQTRLEQISQQLYEWGIPQKLWSCGKSRGMSPTEFAAFWRQFVLTYAEKRNSQGQLVLTDKHRAQLRGFLALRDAGWPSTQSRLRLDPQWLPVKSKSGSNLGWFVFINTKRSQSTPSHKSEPDDAA